VMAITEERGAARRSALRLEPLRGAGFGGRDADAVAE
jgi:hypothetical protein